MAGLEQYMERHALQPKLNEMLNLLAGERPSDPFAWLAEKLEAASAVVAVPSWPQPQDAGADAGIQRMGARWAGVLAFHDSASAVPAAAPAAAPPTAAAAPAAAAPAAAVAAPAAAAAAAGTAGAGAPDKDAKKAAKAEEKRKKEEDKERKRREREEAAQKKADGPEVPTLTLHDFAEHEFGNLLIQSHTKTERAWGRVEGLAAGSEEPVWLRVRLHNSRKQSTKLGFLVFRQRLATVQAVVQGKDLTAFLCGLPKESVLDVLVTVSAAPAPIVSCSESAIELQVLIEGFYIYIYTYTYTYISISIYLYTYIYLYIYIQIYTYICI